MAKNDKRPPVTRYHTPRIVSDNLLREIADALEGKRSLALLGDQVELTEGTEPGTPPAGIAFVYADQSDGRLKKKDSVGIVVDLESAGSVADNSITLAKLAHQTADTVLLMDGSGTPIAALIDTANITDNAVTLVKLAHGTAGNLIGFDGGGAPAEITLGALSTKNTVDTADIDDNAVTVAKQAHHTGAGALVYDVSGVPSAAKVDSDQIASGAIQELRGVALDSSVGSPSDGDILVYRTSGGDWVLEAKPAGGTASTAADLNWTPTGGIPWGSFSRGNLAGFLDAQPRTVKSFGAIGDGNLNDLGDRYGTLGDAQTAYPLANAKGLITTLNHSIDWAAFQEGVIWAQQNDSALLVEMGSYRFEGAAGQYDFLSLDQEAKPFRIIGLGVDGKDTKIRGCPGLDTLQWKNDGLGARLLGSVLYGVRLGVDATVDPSFVRSTIEGRRVRNAGLAFLDPTGNNFTQASFYIDQVYFSTDGSGSNPTAWYSEVELYGVRVGRLYIENGEAFDCGWVMAEHQPFKIASVDTGTDTITLDRTHGLLAGTEVTFHAWTYDGANALPGGISQGLEDGLNLNGRQQRYTVASPSGATLKIEKDGSAVSLSAGLAGDVYMMYATNDSYAMDEPYVQKISFFDIQSVGVSLLNASMGYFGQISVYEPPTAFSLRTAIKGETGNNVVASVYIESRATIVSDIFVVEGEKQTFGMVRPVGNAIGGQNATGHIRGESHVYQNLVQSPNGFLTLHGKNHFVNIKSGSPTQAADNVTNNSAGSRIILSSLNSDNPWTYFARQITKSPGPDYWAPTTDWLHDHPSTFIRSREHTAVNMAEVRVSGARPANTSFVAGGNGHLYDGYLRLDNTDALLAENWTADSDDEGHLKVGVPDLAQRYHAHWPATHCRVWFEMWAENAGDQQVVINVFRESDDALQTSESGTFALTTAPQLFSIDIDLSAYGPPATTTAHYIRLDFSDRSATAGWRAVTWVKAVPYTDTLAETIRFADGTTQTTARANAGEMLLTKNQNNSVDVSTLTQNIRFDPTPDTADGDDWDNTYTLTFTGTPLTSQEFWIINDSGQPQDIDESTGTPLGNTTPFTIPDGVAVLLRERGGGVLWIAGQMAIASDNTVLSIESHQIGSVNAGTITTTDSPAQGEVLSQDASGTYEWRRLVEAVSDNTDYSSTPLSVGSTQPFGRVILLTTTTAADHFLDLDSGLPNGSYGRLKLNTITAGVRYFIRAGAGVTIKVGTISYSATENFQLRGSADWWIEDGGTTFHVEGDVGVIHTLAPYREDSVALAIAAGDVALDWETGNSFFLSLTANVTGWTESNQPATAEAQQMSITFQQDAAGNRTVAWPGAWLWPDGNAGSVSASANSWSKLVLERTRGQTFAAIEQFS